MMEFRYKYRWLTKRLPYAWVHRFLDAFGPTLHRVHRAAQRTRVTRWLAYSFLPWYGISATSEGGGLAHDALIELEKCVTFDALTPLHDHPMTSERFRHTIESEGFRIVHMHDPKISPLYCTAIRA
jgi:hypothetical protein